MTMASAVKRFMDDRGITYHLSSHARTITLEQAAKALGIETHQIARAVLLKDTQGVVMAVLPATHRLDFTKLQHLLQRNLRLVSGKEADKLFKDCEPGSRPPLGEAYGIACVVDMSLLHSKDIYFEPGTHHALVHVSQRDFQDLLGKACKGNFALLSEKSAVALSGKPAEGLEPCAQVQYANVCIERLENTINDACRLPAIPLLKNLKAQLNSPEEIPKELFIEMQAVPNLATLIGRHAELVMDIPVRETQNLEQLANSAYDNQLILVLGIGILSAQAFRVKVQGPFDNKSIWRHAVFSGTIAYEIAQLELTQSVVPHEAFLAAMMQNIGLLLLGYLFPLEYDLLNRLGQSSPGLSLESVERKLLGMGQAHEVVALGHERLGAWLLRNWGFSANVIEVAENHHNPLIGEFGSPYLHLTKLVNNLFMEQGYDKPCQKEYTDTLLGYLGLPLPALCGVYEKMGRVRTSLESVLSIV